MVVLEQRESTTVEPDYGADLASVLNLILAAPFVLLSAALAALVLQIASDLAKLVTLEVHKDFAQVVPHLFVRLRLPAVKQ